MGTSTKRSRVKLTDSRVDALRPGSLVKRIWDSIVPGFHVRVTPAGAKSFCVAFQRKDGKKVNVTIGDVNAWKTEAAREKAATLRQLHEDGKDARAYVQEERAGRDLAALVDVWRADYRLSLKASSRASYDSLFKVVILPVLGQRLVKDLVYQDIKDLHRIAKKGGHETNANRAVAVLSRLLSIAEKEGWRTSGSNPCKQLEKSSERPRDRVLSAEEYALIETALQTLESTPKPREGRGKASRIDPLVADLIRFLALSGLRKGEALGLKFSDVDMERGIMRFEEHKTSNQAGTKILPLNSHLKAIIKRRAAQMLGPYVFAGKKVNAPIVGLAKIWARVLEAAKLSDVTPHDFRRTFMSTCTELGYPMGIGDALLGHSQGRIRDTYVNLGSEGIMAAASQETADWIAAAMMGKQVRPGVKVKEAETINSGTA